MQTDAARSQEEHAAHSQDNMHDGMARVAQDSMFKGRTPEIEREVHAELNLIKVLHFIGEWHPVDNA